MKSEAFSMNEKNELFSKAHSMHDCSFTATWEHNTLVLSFDHLENYYDAPGAAWFADYHKLTIHYRNTEFVNLRLKYGKKEKDYYDTVEPLKGKKLIMHKYCVDCFDQMTLEFYVMIRKKLWGGKLEMAPREIEYIWE